MGSRAEAARKHIVEFIRTGGPATVSAIAVRLRSEGVYKPGPRAFDEDRASKHFARARVNELYRKGVLVCRPHPTQRGTDLWRLSGT